MKQMTMTDNILEMFGLKRIGSDVQHTKDVMVKSVGVGVVRWWYPCTFTHPIFPGKLAKGFASMLEQNGEKTIEPYMVSNGSEIVFDFIAEGKGYSCYGSGLSFDWNEPAIRASANHLLTLPGTRPTREEDDMERARR